AADEAKDDNAEEAPAAEAKPEEAPAADEAKDDKAEA
ncbi:MAG TPA: 30S ribosomal protein S16, partial [Flavobacteriales bacterium]|nr:30S ribosomal protein S16 [Flavobacteriales bacterium]